MNDETQYRWRIRSNSTTNYWGTSGRGWLPKEKLRSFGTFDSFWKAALELVEQQLSGARIVRVRVTKKKRRPRFVVRGHEIIDLTRWSLTSGAIAAFSGADPECVRICCDALNAWDRKTRKAKL